ncbi:glycosyltransferase family 9 protein [Cellulomonas fimi]|uniref:Glycosyl transferase family 9 n=1 Tax=Cellulomonas fimi (strain ATCC 484 / DSM 20113 / JCM 1341 / CCUG 24087 / LMG 16345 / NBRC 15513 / NCIMB 8980 / NCTC 7547 / NRS-133) TaxID=590998 RepID=F4H5Z4_CELFA|nr:glycosyltransferase family 9 protein [Cellulomonas fimi]AEE46724.1 glycosyl transferase family 9 [Cellulomonas fimi ATCC 484]NNH07631.1 glycosyltransferase family 9 protein [Cellulomonas fimi]VEH33994.1 ADP-heptose--LPS heptosyltransferase 2 [Cellulomonas fimi]
MTDATEVTDVLALRALGLGDALTGVPALRGLRRAFPRARLWLAGPGGVGDWLRRQGVVDEVVPVEGLAAPPPIPWTRPGHVAVDLHGRGPASHERLLRTRPRRLVAFAHPAAGHLDGPAWAEDEHEVHRWCRLVATLGVACGPDDLRLVPDRSDGRAVGPVGDVLLHPGAASGSRRWPPARWSALGTALAARGVTVTLTGGPDEVALCEQVRAATRVPSPALRVVSTAGGLDLDALARLVASARLVVCGDTGVAHLATAVGTPTVHLLGPTSPDRWGPLLDRDRHTVLWHGHPDDPGDPHAADPDPALLRITVDEVLAAAVDQLARGPVARVPATA